MANDRKKMAQWKLGPRGRVAPKRKGIMALPANNAAENMRAGAAFTAAQRRYYAIQVVRAAIEALRGRGERITVSSVARQAKMHRNTISACYRDILKAA